MKIVAVVCNVVLLAITGLIVMTEGIPRETLYLILTLLPLSVPVLNLVALLRGRTTNQKQGSLENPLSGGTLLNRAAVLCNLVLLAFTGWAAVAQYPYREGSGVIPFALLMMFTPIISVAALLRGGRDKGAEQQGTMAHQQ